MNAKQKEVGLYGIESTYLISNFGLCTYINNASHCLIVLQKKHEMWKTRIGMGDKINETWQPRLTNLSSWFRRNPID